MSRTLGGRLRAALISFAVVGVALGAASPAVAAAGGPTTPTELFNGDRACSTDAAAPTYLWGGDGVQLEGIPQDTTPSTGTGLTAQYQVWPVADPTQITTLTHTLDPAGFEAAVSVQNGLTDGQTYAWQTQTVDGSAASAWSAPCYFAVDNTPPSAAPTVTSANYPQGGWDKGGAPVQFTFGANGVSDVAGYEFGWQSDLPVPETATIGAYGIPQPVDVYADTKQFVPASTLGGSVTVNLIPPSGSGPMTLYVVSLDRAVNESTQSSYAFYVSDTGPTVTPPTPLPGFDKTAKFTFTPNSAVQAASPVVSYTVQINGGPSVRTVTVKAARNGTAELGVKLNGNTGTWLNVSSTSANGWVTDATWWTTGNVDTTPTVSSDVYVENGTSGGVGVPGTFTFAPKQGMVASYTYSFNSGPAVTVKAGAKGTATISWTPTDDGFYDLNVYATTKDGLVLSAYDYFFSVN
jgi:hypothetical protein